MVAVKIAPISKAFAFPYSLFPLFPYPAETRREKGKAFAFPYSLRVSAEWSWSGKNLHIAADRTKCRAAPSY
jgi:hypothetical protein